MTQRIGNRELMRLLGIPCTRDVHVGMHQPRSIYPRFFDLVRGCRFDASVYVTSM